MTRPKTIVGALGMAVGLSLFPLYFLKWCVLHPIQAFRLPAIFWKLYRPQISFAILFLISILPFIGGFLTASVLLVSFVASMACVLYIKEKAAQQESGRTADIRQRLLARNRDVVDKFLRIAERKVAVIDEYGDESWGALSAEILECLKKIAQREGQIIDFTEASKLIRQGSPCHLSPGMPEDYRWLAEQLDCSYREHHQFLKTKGTDTRDLNQLSGIEFETWIASLLRNNGFEDVSGTPATGDQGADLIARKDGRTIIIQAKRYEGVVGNKAVQEVIAAQHFYDGDEGWVVTNSTFSPSARNLAQKSNVRLIDGHGLRHFDPTAFK